MNTEAMPRIRLEVEHMKHTILNYLGANNSDLGEALKTEIERSIENYDWQNKVDEIVHEAITKHISEYFTYGTGRDLIKEALREGFNAAFNKY